MADYQFNLTQVMQATNAVLKKLTSAAVFGGVTTDTRKVEEGMLFVALKGEKFDGHDFIAQAAQKGAIGAIVNKDYDVSLLEDEAYRRAVKGINKGVYYRGEKIAVEKEYSDSLLALLLRANAPDKYKQVVDSTVKNDITIKNTALADALAERMSKADE